MKKMNQLRCVALLHLISNFVVPTEIAFKEKVRFVISFIAHRLVKLELKERADKVSRNSQ